MIPTWAERCEKFANGEIVTNAKIQQVMQEEIDELRKELALQKLSDIGQVFESFYRTASPMADKYVSYRELTDEEMLEVYKKVFNKQNEFKENLKRRSYFDFARAVLKKASEK
jgi:hypothetical protein